VNRTFPDNQLHDIEIFVEMSLKAVSDLVSRIFYVSGKLEKYLYAEIISKDKRKIVIRRDIENFDELIQVIENQTGKSFEAT
jgi:hypothetical protein